MARINLDVARVFAIEANNQIKSGVKEDVLRHLLSSRLPLMFPENPWWIQEHSTGAESNVYFVDTEGKKRTGFVDSLIGKTMIEYEKNLTVKSIYAEGYSQVEKYCSALLNRGVSHKDIIGVLSDTVRWYAFEVDIENEPTPGNDYGSSNIVLKEIDSINLENYSDYNLTQFGKFINNYLGREGSRCLDAESLALDMGFDSNFYRRHIGEFCDIVDSAFKDKEHYGKMISSLWQNFVTYFEGGSAKDFDKEVYSNELYMITLSKLLCANILQGSVIRDYETSLARILNGQWFKERGFVNIVEYDYFGWLNETPFIERICLISQDMQSDFAAYDFENIETEDLFGSLMAQLAEKDRRLLLGQEFTPQWIARKIVSRTIQMLPQDEYPSFIDMCCGSGVFIVETLKQTIERYNITPSTCKNETLNALMNCVFGFDIDPLAVMLAKMNWALAMRDFIQFSSAELSIPIYHADSLFAIAPITGIINDDYENQSVLLTLDGEKVMLPGFLISTDNRTLFDVLIKTCYETAKALAIHTTSESEYKRNQAEVFVKRIIGETATKLEDEHIDCLIDSCLDLILALQRLQREGRNGIWTFLLGNGYRPGLVKKQFNAIVSNPPWLAMSKLANNPYKNVLAVKSEHYGIKPTGSSHLHIELATIFLLHAVDEYLQDGTLFGIVMPDTLLNGFHHEPFRKQKYLKSKRSVKLNIGEIWELPDVFKNKGIVMFGQKSITPTADKLHGKCIYLDRSDKQLEYRLIQQGKRTAWTSNPKAKDIEEILDSIPFLQGADIMPRTLVFHKVAIQPNGKWALKQIPRQRDDLSYLVSDAKKNKEFFLEARDIDGQFIYDCYMSNHILPFLSCPSAKALLPIKKADEHWVAIDEIEIASFGASTVATFSQIFSAVGEDAQQYFTRINYRNKLNPQQFEKIVDEHYLVLVGAGGGYTCAAYISIESLNKEKIIIDQTLYWYIAKSEDEAIYITALLNSNALDTIISDFQPEGAMGRRHVHKLPYAVTPRFDIENITHKIVVEKTRLLKAAIDAKLANSKVFEYISPARSSLAVRRRKIREFIRSLSEYNEYETSCKDVYGV